MDGVVFRVIVQFGLVCHRSLMEYPLQQCSAAISPRFKSSQQNKKFNKLACYARLKDVKFPRIMCVLCCINELQNKSLILGEFTKQIKVN